MLQVQPIGVELGHAAGRNHHTGSVAAKLDDVQSIQQGAAEGARQPVVGRGCPGEQVYLRGWFGADYRAALVRTQRWNWDCEEGRCHSFGLLCLKEVRVMILVGAEGE